METNNSFKITYTNRFLKSFNRLTIVEQTAFENKMKLFVKNNMHPSLRTKKIIGHKDMYESSINMDIRIIWYYEDQHLIILIDIGYHDILRNL